MKFLFKKFLKKKGQVSKGGAILDQVIAESAAPDNKCLLYKLANFKGGEKIRWKCLKNQLNWIARYIMLNG